MKNFQFLLLKRLKETGITQRKLAEMLDIPEQCVGRWVSGKVIPRIDTLAKICRCLDCTPNDLIVID